MITHVTKHVSGVEPHSFSHVDLTPAASVSFTDRAYSLLTPSLDLFDMLLVAFDPLNLHHKKRERCALPEPSKEADAELERLLGPRTNRRYADLEFACPTTTLVRAK